MLTPTNLWKAERTGRGRMTVTSDQPGTVRPYLSLTLPKPKPPNQWDLLGRGGGHTLIPTPGKDEAETEFADTQGTALRRCLEISKVSTVSVNFLKPLIFTSSVSVDHMCAWCPSCQMRALDPGELELQATVTMHHVGAGSSAGATSALTPELSP